MRFLSTRGGTPPTSLEEALFSGLAPDGGLFVAEDLTPLSDSFLHRLHGRQQESLAIELADHLIGDDLDRDSLEGIVGRSLDFEVPLVELDAKVGCLELFHGPTLAFKDVGARFMAELMSHFRRREQAELTILVATSGDTGGAVANAFAGRAGFRVVVLFPVGQISEPQQKLFTTVGGNVDCLAVDGSFDDCQDLVKTAFGDHQLRAMRELASANSINVGRLLPQIFYYFFAVAQLRASVTAAIFSTPSGNFGNLTAGLMAKRLGLPCGHFVAATNRNDVVPRYLESGVFEPQPSLRTLANAMDVGNPSNLSRIRHLYGDDLESLRADLIASRWDDNEVLATIEEVHQRIGYVLDPHSAIAYMGLESVQARHPESYGIFLATAHPAKFSHTVKSAIGDDLEIPAALSRRLDCTEIVTPMSADYADFRDYLVSVQKPVSS